MKANNLSISIPNKGCNKSCPYCVSKITPNVENNEKLFIKNIHKVKKMADITGVTSVSITGKGEPTLNMSNVYDVLHTFTEYVTELQTNGKVFEDKEDCNNLLYQLSLSGLNVIAFLIDTMEQFETLEYAFNKAWEYGIIPRVTINITNLLPEDITFEKLLKTCKLYGVKQMSLRQVVKPNNCEENKHTKWIDENVNPNMYNRLIQEFQRKAEQFLFIRSLPYGAKLFDVKGISFTYFDYCIQDSSNGNDIRSLIYQQDGHCYTTWNNPASIIF